MRVRVSEPRPVEVAPEPPAPKPVKAKKAAPPAASQKEQE